MDFTAAFRHASSACIAYSPGSTFLALISGDLPRTLLVRASSTLQVIRSWDFDTDISTIEWSNDGSFLLVTTTSRQEDGVVYVLSLDPGKEANDGTDENQGWVARIASGSEGLISATWTPLAGPRSVVLFSQHQLRASIYSLPDQTIAAVEGPKRNKLLRSAKRADQFAMILKGSDRDQIHIFKCEKISAEELRRSVYAPASEKQWQLETAFNLATNDCADAAWSPDDLHIAAWEGQLEYKLLIYTPLGQLRSIFAIEPNGTGDPTSWTPHLDGSSPAIPPHSSPSLSQGALRSSSTEATGTKLRSSALASSTSTKPRREEESLLAVAGGGLGIRAVRWHPSGKFIAIGGYDERIYILEDQEWTVYGAFDLSKRTVSFQGGEEPAGLYGYLSVWREPLNWFEETHARGIVPFEAASLPLSPAALRLDADKANPKLGISWMEWSPNGNLLASFNERLPFTLFVHAFASDDATALTRPYLVAVLQMSFPIKSTAWKPAHPGKLGIVCENQAIYTWELLESGSESVRYTQRAEATPVPIDDFRASGVQWSPDGQKILITSDQTFCCAFETLDEPVRLHADESGSINYSQ